MFIWNVLRCFNAFLACLPAGMVINPLFGIGMLVDNNQARVAQLYNFLDYAKIVFIAYLISEVGLYIARRQDVLKARRYLILLPIITALGSIVFVGWDYLSIIPTIVMGGFVISPIAWGIYIIVTFVVIWRTAR